MSVYSQKVGALISIEVMELLLEVPTRGDQQHTENT